MNITGATLIDWGRQLWRDVGHWRYSPFVKRVLLRALALMVLSGAFVNHVDSHEVGIAWNFVTGALTLQRGGFHLTWPWVTVSSIDARPHRLCVSNAGRAIACRLVRFEPDGFREFVATEGHHYYWWANRISFNGGHDEEYRGIRDILRGYAFSSRPDAYRFIHIESTGP